MSKGLKKIRMFLDFTRSYFDKDYEYDYWHMPLKVSDMDVEGDYFLDLSPKADFPGPFDEKGIPLLDLSTQHYTSRSDKVYFPVTILQYGLGMWARHMKSRDSRAKRAFTDVVEWIFRKHEISSPGGEDLASIYTNFHGGRASSAMAHGQAVSLLVRAYRMDRPAGALDLAKSFFNTFKYVINNGGVVSGYEGVDILEEHTTDPVHVLNGHIFAFFGLIDLLALLRETGDPDTAEVERYYDKYLFSTEQLVIRCDTGFWSRYCIKRNIFTGISSRFYHELHIQQLKALYNITGRELFRSYAEKWEENSSRTFNSILAYLIKTAGKIWLSVFLRGKYRDVGDDPGEIPGIA